MVGLFERELKGIIDGKVLDKDECAVPFSEKSELWAGDDTLSIPSCFIMLMDSALADRSHTKERILSLAETVCIDVS